MFELKLCVYSKFLEHTFFGDKSNRWPLAIFPLKPCLHYAFKPLEVEPTWIEPSQLQSRSVVFTQAAWEPA